MLQLESSHKRRYNIALKTTRPRYIIAKYPHPPRYSFPTALRLSAIRVKKTITPYIFFLLDLCGLENLTPPPSHSEVWWSRTNNNFIHKYYQRKEME